VEAVLRNRRSILTVSAWTAGFGCALSLPRLVSGDGVVCDLGVSTDAEERERLERSAQVLREALAHID
jgi:L-lactate dehydrogenase